MTTIAGPRGSGKTTELIRRCAEENANGFPAAILVADKKRAEYVAYLALQIKINIPLPVTLDEVKDGAFRGSFIEKILVDDADDLMRRILGREAGLVVSAMTFTVDEQQGDVTLLRAELDQESGMSPLPDFVGTTDKGGLSAEFIKALRDL